MSDTKKPEHPLFKLVILSSAAFLITVLAMIVSMLSPSGSPIGTFFSDNGGRMIGIEVVLIIGFGIAAMTADRRRIVREQQLKDAEDEQPTDSEGTS